METLAPASLARHVRLRVCAQQAIEFLDITDHLVDLVQQAQVAYGLLNVQTLHTTTAIVVNEQEPLLLQDFADALEAAAPAGWSYRHDSLARHVNRTPDERINGHSHCRALLLPTSVCLNVADGVLQLGRWQRVFFVELDGPRERELSVLITGESRP